MTKVRIFKPARTATQSGQAKTKQWRLEFVRSARRNPDPLMGWNGSDDTQSQVALAFPSREDAIAFAEANGYEYEVLKPHEPVIRPKSYAENFRVETRAVPSRG